MTELVLGAGMAGLIYHHFNPDSIVISKDVGGQAISLLPLGPRFIYKNKTMDNFLNELGLDVSGRTIKIGYYDGWFVEPDEAFVSKYLAKTRSKESLEGGIVTDRLKLFEAYKLHTALLLMELSKDPIVRAEITHIDLRQKVVFTTMGAHSYDTLVSTLPMPDFCRLANVAPMEPPEWNSILYKAVFKGHRWALVQDKDFIYVADENIPYYRITKWYDSVMGSEEIAPQPRQKTYGMYRHWQNYGKIISGTPPKLDGVKFFGRWARWKNKIMISDLVKSLI